MFEKGIAPPHIGIKGQLNEKLDMSRTSIKISQVPSPFIPGPGRKRRRVLVNNFSAAVSRAPFHENTNHLCVGYNLIWNVPRVVIRALSSRMLLRPL